MEFTKQEKNRLYTECLKDIESYEMNHCCGSLWANITDKFKQENNLTSSKLIDISHELFSELYALKTRNCEFGIPAYWFSNREERIEALQKCIEQTKS